MSALETPPVPNFTPHRGDVTLWTVYAISKSLGSPERLEATLARTLELLAGFLELKEGLINLLDEEGKSTLVVGPGWTEGGAQACLDRLPTEAVEEVVRSGTPLVVTSIREDPRFRRSRPSAFAAGAEVAFVAVPIREQGTVIGTLSVERERDQPVRLDEEVRLLTMVAGLLGQTVHLQRLVARDRERLLEEQSRLNKLLDRAGARRPSEPVGIVGDSPTIKAVTEKLRIVAKSHSTVLLRGESGTGKELFAQALHRLSPRHDKPFVAVNCAALPESVLESELFGHEKGAFTNASGQRRGRFELADGGTLFLDEIGDISPAFQAKLLRVLQEGELERVGGSATIKVDVRVVAATNRDLEDAVARGQFRADLYYRISVVPLFLPPLRDRKPDIAPLAREFLRRFNEEHGTTLEFEGSGLEVLRACTFPGNVRELENCVRRTATFARTGSLKADDFACRHQECLSASLWRHSMPQAAAQPAPAPSVPFSPFTSTPSPIPRVAAEPETPERERLLEAMESAGWVQARAARMLGLTPRQIGYALKKHNVPLKKF